MAEPQDNGTIIGADTVIKGEMTAENRARIFGRFEGKIKAKGEVELAQKATCQGDIEARLVKIDGGMQGNITASEKVHLNTTADLKGDVTANKLVVEDGARLDGHFKIGPDMVKKAPSGPGPVGQPGPMGQDEGFKGIPPKDLPPGLKK